MLKIGEFSKLSHLTVKALRFYEKKGLLLPTGADAKTGYRFYETEKLEEAAKIKRLRQLGFSISEIQALLLHADGNEMLQKKAQALKMQKADIERSLLVIQHILEERDMKYQAVEKNIPGCIVYYSEVKVENFGEMMEIIPSLGEECLRLNPDIRCLKPDYEFCEYLDGYHKEKNIKIRHSQAVDRMGAESERIRFRTISPVKVLSIYHKGGYDSIGEAYAFLFQYAEKNGYQKAGLPRECYIDGIWNKESEEDWLTEIQLPIV